MKKVNFFLLVLALGLSLCACSSNDTTEIKDYEAINSAAENQEEASEITEPKIDILGEWVSYKDNTYTVTFQEDGNCFYTGTPGINMETELVASNVNITLDDTASSTETTTLPEANASVYKYSFNPEVSIITIYASTSANYEVKIEDGKTVIEAVGGEEGFVRAENYEEYHAEYFAEMQAQFDDFYAEGKEGCTELEFNTAYTIQDGLNMTVTDCALVENTNTFNIDYIGNNSHESLYLKILLENISDEGIYIRQDGIYKDGVYWFEWGSDVRANIEVKRFGEVGSNIDVYMMGTEISHDVLTDASDYIFKYEELEENIRLINGGNHIYLEPKEKGEYYLYITPIDIEQVKQSPMYAIITFDNYDFFSDLSALAESLE